MNLENATSYKRINYYQILCSKMWGVNLKHIPQLFSVPPIYLWNPTILTIRSNSNEKINEYLYITIIFW